MTTVSEVPYLICKWDYNRNYMSPHTTTIGSNKSAWWVCDSEDHSWQAAVKSVARGSRCTYCYGKKVLPGFNDMVTLAPDMGKIWDYDINTDDPRTIAPNSNNPQRYWVCTEHGHTWKASPNSVYRSMSTGKSGCPVCSGKKVLPGFNDLGSLRPNIATMWDYEKNDKTPEEVTSMSGYRAWWLCPEGHTWDAYVYNVTESKGCPVCSSHRLVVGINDLKTYNPPGMDTWDYELNSTEPEEYFQFSNKIIHRKCSMGHRWTSPVADIGRFGCPRCSKSVSSYEDEIAEFLEQFTPVIRNTRKIIPPKEVDIYLPEYDLCIEVNGVYYHSNKFKAENSDRDKRDLIVSAGMDFLAIWEDEWLYKKDVVKAHLISRVGMTPEKVYARNTEVVAMTYGESSEFMDRHHIQGKSRGSIYLGLRDKLGEVVAAMVLLRRSTGVLEVARYATSKNVPGGHSKLINYTERTYQYDYLVTFADLQVSSGRLYMATGWTKDREIGQDYKYVVGLRRVHKFNYRKKRFVDDPDLKYVEGLTEKQLADLNNIYRVYDYGKIRFVRPNPNRLGPYDD